MESEYGEAVFEKWIQYCEKREGTLKETVFLWNCRLPAKGTGEGGAFITVRDIVSFWTNLPEGNLISKAFVSDMISKQSGDGDDVEEG